MLEVAEKMEMIKKESQVKMIVDGCLIRISIIFYCQVCTQMRICLGLMVQRKSNKLVEKWNIWCLQYL